MIPIKEESSNFRANFGCYENCHFCRKPTSTWHENTNNPVCSRCAKEHRVKELPDHGAEIRARKRRERESNGR